MPTNLQLGIHCMRYEREHSTILPSHSNAAKKLDNTSEAFEDELKRKKEYHG